MCNWKDMKFPYGKGVKIQLKADTFAETCKIISKAAQEKHLIAYSDLMQMLKKKKHEKINRRTIGHILGEVSNQVSQSTNPSVYPSAIVIRKDTSEPGKGFWGLDMGTNPPSKVPQNKRQNTLQHYQNDVFNRPWNCNC
jgi:hypothetical protein